MTQLMPSVCACAAGTPSIKLTRTMFHLATWIRERDEAHFARFFTRHPEIQVHNARVGPSIVHESDGLLLTGGPDVAAEFHAKPVSDLSLIKEPEPARDEWEITAAQTAYERGLPMLCICKGLQVLNLALGGTLHLDISGHDLPEQKSHNIQPLRYAARAPHRFEKVNSSHHQALDRIAAPLEVEAWSVADAIVEQVRIRDYPFGVGVQYHPERDLFYLPLFEAFFTHLKHGRSSQATGSAP